MSVSNLINSFGLVLDIVGVVLIWKFGLPEPLSRAGAQSLLLEGTDHTEVAKAVWYDRLSKLGLGLLVAGFSFQLLSNFVTS